MKKILLLLLAVGCWFAVVAVEPGTSWVDSNEGKLIVKKITLNDTNAKLILENGEKKVVPLGQITAYSKNGKVFKKLPLYVDEKPTGQFVFMELIKTQGELCLYRYSSWSYNPNIKINTYLLFRGVKLMLEFDEKSCH